LALALKKALDGIGKSRVRQPMRAVGGCGQQSPGHFVLPLCAALKACHPVLDAPLKRLVVARFKVQAIDALQSGAVSGCGRMASMRSTSCVARSMRCSNLSFMNEVARCAYDR